MDEKLKAIIEFTGDNDANQAQWGENVYETDGCEYLVLTDGEADSYAQEYIKDILWAFNASFLSSMTELPEEMFSALQEQCEGANDAFLRVVEKTCGLEEFCDEAIRYDGRGHFLASYDLEENEQDEFYIYRVN